MDLGLRLASHTAPKRHGQRIVRDASRTYRRSDGVIDPCFGTDSPEQVEGGGWSYSIQTNHGGSMWSRPCAETRGGAAPVIMQADKQFVARVDLLLKPFLDCPE